MRLIIISALLVLLAFAGCETPRAVSGDDRQPGSREAVVADTGYAIGPMSRGGTGRYYMGRQIARVMGHEGAAWLERPERAHLELPDLVVDSLGLRPDDHVADIGAGTGYFTTRLARAVPDGFVYAVDVQPEMLSMLEARLATEGISNVLTVLGAESDTRLEPQSIDIALIVDAYHEFAYPQEMLRSIHEALVPGGRLVLIEYRTEESDSQIHPLHRMSEEQVRRELDANGFRWVETKHFLPMQHFLVFER